MTFNTETWVTATGNYQVIKMNSEFVQHEVATYNKGKDDQDAVWIPGKESAQSHAFGETRVLTVLRRRFIQEDGRVAEVTLAINPAHVYSVRSTYVSTK